MDYWRMVNTWDSASWYQRKWSGRYVYLGLQLRITSMHIPQRLQQEKRKGFWATWDASLFGCHRYKEGSIKAVLPEAIHMHPVQFYEPVTSFSIVNILGPFYADERKLPEVKESTSSGIRKHRPLSLSSHWGRSIGFVRYCSHWLANRRIFKSTGRIITAAIARRPPFSFPILVPSAQQRIPTTLPLPALLGLEDYWSVFDIL